MSGFRWGAAAAVFGCCLVVVAASGAQSAVTQIASCGQTVTTDAVLTQDLVCPGDGIVVGANGITIDLKGFRLRGDRGAGDYGIDDSGGFDRVTVKNGVLRNFGVGIRAFDEDPGEGADKLSLSNLVASGNSGIGIDVWGALARLSGTTAAGNTFSGIFVISNSATISGATAAGNGDTGIAVIGDSAKISGATVVGNGSSGIIVAGSSAKISSTTAAGNIVDGIGVFGDSANINLTTATGNTEFGIRVSGHAATIRGNRADGNGFPNGNSDENGLGIGVNFFSSGAPTGTNSARGNDDPAECEPASLC